MRTEIDALAQEVLRRAKDNQAEAARISGLNTGWWSLYCRGLIRYHKPETLQKLQAALPSFTLPARVAEDGPVWPKGSAEEQRRKKLARWITNPNTPDKYVDMIECAMACHDREKKESSKDPGASRAS